MKNPSTVIAKADLEGDSTGGDRAFLYGSSDSAKGFLDTAVWTEWTTFKKAAAALSAGDVTYAAGSPKDLATAKFSGLKTTVSEVGTHIAGGAGFKVTNTITYQPDAVGSDFVTNGLLYSHAVSTLNQNTP